MLVAIKSYFLVDGESGSAEIDLKGVNKIGANRWFVLVNSHHNLLFLHLSVPDAFLLGAYFFSLQYW